MLGSDLVEFLVANGEEVAGYHRGDLEINPVDSEAGNSSFRLAASGFDPASFDVVVNCIAYTKVDLAEDLPDEAAFANVEIPRLLAKSLFGSKTRLIHISTDYVFDGSKGFPYLPEDKKNPLGVYGRTKSAGEDVVLETHPLSQVIRTSWLYGKNGKCFPKTIGSKLSAGEDVSVVSDQFGSPTHTFDLAEFIYRAGREPITSRILHGVSQGSCSWFEFANAIRGSVVGAVPHAGAIKAVSTSQYPTKAQRPSDSTLKPSSVAGWQIGPWEERWELASRRVIGF